MDVVNARIAGANSGGTPASMPRTVLKVSKASRPASFQHEGEGIGVEWTSVLNSRHSLLVNILKEMTNC